MPTYGWILESAIDRWSDALVGEPAPAIPPLEARKPIWSCHLPWCGQEFPSELRLDEHLFQAHRQVDIILRIGKRVYTDSPVIIDEPGAVLVVADGLDGVMTTLALPPEWKETPVVMRRQGRRALAELPAALVAAFPPRLRLSVSWGQSHRRFDVYHSASVELDELAAVTVEQAATALQDAVANGDPDWTAAQREFDASPGLERRYGLGLFEYLFAHSEAAMGRPAKETSRHFERAHWLLSPFSRPLARMVSDVVSFRLGWYDRLAKTTVHRLEAASSFFRVPPRPPTRPSPRTDTRSARLILDDFHQIVLDVVDAYWAKDYDRCSVLLKDLGTSPRLVERHLSEKFHLLKARTSTALGDAASARASYGDLLESLLFKDEARASI